MARNSRRHQRALSKHAERLAAVDRHLASNEFYQALEMIRRILADVTLAPEARVRTKGKEVEALIGAERLTEAFRAAVDLERMCDRFRLDRLSEELEPLVAQAKALRGAG